MQLINFDVDHQYISDAIIDGQSTGLFDPNSTKYSSFYNTYEQMIKCNWVKEEIDVIRDKSSYANELLPSEKRAYSLVLAQIIFMDSLQTLNTNINVIPFITDPIATSCLTRQAYEESLHSDTYYVLSDTIYENPQEIYNMWKTDDVLKEKNQFIANMYDKYGEVATESDDKLLMRCRYEVAFYRLISENGTREGDLFKGVPDSVLAQDIISTISKLDHSPCTFDELVDAYKLDQEQKRFEARVLMIVANQALEGIYFFTGFLIIYLLGRMGKMLASVDAIRFIQRDELNHTALYRNIFRTIRKENIEKFTPELYIKIRQILVDAANLECKWGKYVTQNQIIGIDDDRIDSFVHYLANDRYKSLGLDEVKNLQYPFPDSPIKDCPIDWFDKYSKLNLTKTNFFESKVKNYDNRGLDLTKPIKIERV